MLALPQRQQQHHLHPRQAMTRLPPDSFLPSGAALDDTRMAFSAGLSGESSSSVVSPLALPRGALHYFDAQANGQVLGQVLPNGVGNGSSGHGAYYSTGNGRSPGHVYSPMSPSLYGLVNGPPPAASKSQPPDFISPRMAPTSTQIHHQLQQLQRQQIHQRQQQQQEQQQHHQQRSASLSPIRRSASLGAGSVSRTRSAMASPSRVPLPPNGFGTLGSGGVPRQSGPTSAPAGSSGHYGANGLLSPVLQSRSLPDASSEPSSSMSTLAQRVALLERQNSLIRQSWEHERMYLEANRARAAEVYEEERAIMDLERSTWEADRAALEDELSRLRDEVMVLRSGGGGGSGGRFHHVGSIPEEEDEHLGTRAGRESMSSGGSGRTSVSSAQGGPPQHASRYVATQSHAFQSEPTISKQSQPPGYPPSSSATRPAALSPSRQPESSPFIPLSQHQQHQPTTSPPVPAQIIAGSSSGSPPGAAADPAMSPDPVPVIDVQIIHPELEGIPIKQTAIQKPTFTDREVTSPSSGASARTSPPLRAFSGNSSNSPPHQHASSAETLKVLSAPETARLTMHAGHTPNHSLSAIPTVMSTAAPTTASSSGDVTPTTTTGPLGDLSAASAGSGGASGDLVEPPATMVAMADSADPTAAASATLAARSTSPPADEDRPLRGPLMIRNQPAHDEIFLRRLSEKLEDVKNGEDAVPTVLKNESLEAAAAGVAPGGDGADDKSEVVKSHQADRDSPTVRSSSSSRSGHSNAESAALDIPLRIRKTSNFGAPLGEMRAHAHVAH